MSTKNLNSAKAEKNSAQASMFNMLALALFVLIAGAVIYFVGGAILHFLLGVLQFFTFLVAAFFTLGMLAAPKNSKQADDIKAGLTNREAAHRLHNWKPVDQCTDEEKADFAKKADTHSGILILLSTSIWIMPILFSLIGDFKLFPINWLALPITILGLVVWVLISNATAKQVGENFDKKVEATASHYFLIKFTGLLLAVYELLILASLFGIL